MTNSEFREELEVRTRDFSVRVFRFLDALPKKTSTQVIAYQLGKSASSIGANYREATRAESREDFGHKLQIALKEAAESCYWLEVLKGLYPMHTMIAGFATNASRCVICCRESQNPCEHPSVPQPKHPNNPITQTPFSLFR